MAGLPVSSTLSHFFLLSPLLSQALPNFPSDHPLIEVIARYILWKSRSCLGKGPFYAIPILFLLSPPTGKPLRWSTAYPVLGPPVLFPPSLSAHGAKGSLLRTPPLSPSHTDLPFFFSPFLPFLDRVDGSNIILLPLISNFLPWECLLCLFASTPKPSRIFLLEMIPFSHALA